MSMRISITCWERIGTDFVKGNSVLLRAGVLPLICKHLSKKDRVVIMNTDIGKTSKQTKKNHPQLWQVFMPNIEEIQLLWEWKKKFLKVK